MNEAELTASLIREESFEREPYLDSKQLWTFAVGRCLERNPLTATEWKVLLDRELVVLRVTLEGAEYLLQEGYAAIQRALTLQLPNWFTINDARQNALIEMCYQNGTGILDVSSPHCWPDLTAAVKRAEWEAVYAAALDSKWAREDSPARARRVAERLKTGAF